MESRGLDFYLNIIMLAHASIKFRNSTTQRFAHKSTAADAFVDSDKGYGYFRH